MSRMKEFDKTWMAARGWYTTGRMIEWKCPRCGATGSNMADKCAAPLEDPCPGFQRTEEVYTEFSSTWRALVGDDQPAQQGAKQ